MTAAGSLCMRVAAVAAMPNPMRRRMRPEPLCRWVRTNCNLPASSAGGAPRSAIAANPSCNARQCGCVFQRARFVSSSGVTRRSQRAVRYCQRWPDQSSALAIVPTLGRSSPSSSASISSSGSLASGRACRRKPVTPSRLARRLTEQREVPVKVPARGLDGFVVDARHDAALTDVVAGAGRALEVASEPGVPRLNEQPVLTLLECRMPSALPVQVHVDA